MIGRPTDFWGKLCQEEDGTVREWHPLVAHAADVAACCEALLRATVLGRRFARLAGRARLSHTDITRLSVLAAFHDLGKFNAGFQRKGIPGTGPTAGHVAEVLALLGDSPSAEQERLLESIPFGDLQSWAPDNGAFPFLAAAIGHHGRPVPVNGAKHQCSYWRSIDGRNPFDGIRDLSTRVREWFPDAFQLGAADLPTNPELQHAFSGLVMLADWMGSDTRFFPYADSLSDRMPHARERARQALREAWIETSRAQSGLGDRSPTFATVSAYQPRHAQRATAELPIDPESASLVLLESETGSGKTEAALVHFVRLLHAGAVDGLYFALPTRTAATQIHRRVCEAVDRAFPDGARPAVVLAVPGYLAVDDRVGRMLPGFQVLWNDDPKERFRYRGWAAEHPKRFLAGSVIVGTVDQVLLSTLMVSHAHMRATSLLRHLLVVDEVHASDAYMTALLGCVLDNHLAAGGHALLMSATLGSRARGRLLSRRRAPAPLRPPEIEVALAYPLVTVHCAAGDVRAIAVASDTTDKEVAVTLEPWMAEPAQIAIAALAAARGGAAVLVLRNTVADCLATQQALETLAADAAATLLFACNGRQAPHHARFSKEDREALDRALETCVSSEAEARGFVAVATQTVQQSLDLDFDFLLTDLSPMDVLLQRIGRLHRHSRRRPTDYAGARAVLLVPADRDLGRCISAQHGKPMGRHGIGTVYEDLRILEATWRALEQWPTLAIPSMNRLLVEHTTHTSALDAIARDGGELWKKHAQWVVGTHLSSEQLARLNVIRRDISFDNDRIGFPSAELERRIRTRLGEDDRLVEFVPSETDGAGDRSRPRAQPLRSPFGTRLTRLTIPAHMARGIAGDATVDVLHEKDAEIVFRFGAKRFVYDRLGLRAEQPDPDDLEE